MNKEVIFDKSIKAELFKEFEMILVDKYKLNNDNEDKNNKNEKQIESLNTRLRLERELFGKVNRSLTLWN